MIAQDISYIRQQADDQLLSPTASEHAEINFILSFI
jgi:hypothetical protein